MNADAIFDFLEHNPNSFTGVMTALYLSGTIEAEQCDFWIASPERWMVSRNFYAP